MTDIPRPKLTLKKKPAPLATPASDVQKSTPALNKSVESKPPKSPSPSKTEKAAALKAEKEAKRLENIRLGSEAAARKRAQLAQAKPLVAAYFAAKTIITDVVLIDGVAIYHPLAIGTRQRVIAELLALPQCEGISASALNALVSELLHAHTTQEAYQRGLLLLGERVNLDGSVAGTVAPKHKIKAQVWLDRVDITRQ
ncbi:MAG: hypothetical protein IPH35_16040 [Rhodoferax sp.]|nr:hypothetical protein [Rhodoferax sp.]